MSVRHYAIVIGSRLQKLRKFHDLTQKQLLAKCNSLLSDEKQNSSDTQTIKRMEKDGEHRHDPNFVRVVASVLNTTVDYLAGRSDQSEDPYNTAEYWVQGPLKAVHQAETSEAARTIIEQVLKGDIDPLVRIRLLANMAIESPVARKRGDYFRKAVHELDDVVKSSCAFEIADLYATTAVDCAQDRLSGLDTKFKEHALGAARYVLDTQLKAEQSSSRFAVLLARKAAVLRYQAFRAKNQAKKKLHYQSLATAKLAVDKAENPITLLEAGLSSNALASCIADNGLLAEAESYLTRPELKRCEVGLLALAWFYRMQLRHKEACEVYHQLCSSSLQTRRTLRTGFIYGEAADRLCYSILPTSEIRFHLEQARPLLRNAINSGYRHARIIIALAHVTASLGEISDAQHILNEVFDNNGVLSWDKVMENLQQTSQFNPEDEAFALGLRDPGVLNSIGTFVKERLKDSTRAEGIYRYAMRVDPHAVEPCKSLALLLQDKGDNDSLREASSLVAKGNGMGGVRGRWLMSLSAHTRQDVQSTSPFPPSGDRKMHGSH